MNIGFGFQAVIGENAPLSILKCWNFIFLLGLCLLGAGVEGKEGSVTAEEQMKSTFIPIWCMWGYLQFVRWLQQNYSVSK